jgi:hypothetical protein
LKLFAGQLQALLIAHPSVDAQDSRILRHFLFRLETDLHFRFAALGDEIRAAILTFINDSGKHDLVVLPRPLPRPASCRSWIGRQRTLTSTPAS